MIRTAATALATLLTVAALAMAAPAQADDQQRAQTTSIMKVMPGAADTVFEAGDPIRFCFGVQTDVVFDGHVAMVIEMKGLYKGAKWHVVKEAAGSANTVGCAFGTIQGSGDSLLRSRTLKRPGVLPSTSRVLTIHAE